MKFLQDNSLGSYLSSTQWNLILLAFNQSYWILNADLHFCSRLILLLENLTLSNSAWRRSWITESIFPHSTFQLSTIMGQDTGTSIDNWFLRNDISLFAFVLEAVFGLDSQMLKTMISFYVVAGLSQPATSFVWVPLNLKHKWTWSFQVCVCDACNQVIIHRWRGWTVVSVEFHFEDRVFIGIISVFY